MLSLGQIMQGFLIEEHQDEFTPWTDSFKEHWTWDKNNRSPDVYLCLDNRLACFHTDPVTMSTGTAAVRGNKAFTHGKHYWEVKLSDIYGTSVMVGVGTKNAALHTGNYEYVNLIGRDKQSWGLSHKGEIWHNGIKTKFCDPFFDATVIGILLDMDFGTLSFFKNKQLLGVAFTGVGIDYPELYPIVSSTAAESEVEIGDCSCKYTSLQDQCCKTILKYVPKDKVNMLPLPPVICGILHDT
ncbi:SPRY domain-containing SOCS box protein 3 isoform X1 [Exaiptasia diaphana]|uniref:SPRY domain-containing SOCS box protein 3 n=1 Tax=Exaiptasia diaphana TaxID=2652724 RepID=A0A913XEF0_EXADI|nr:SPRY domain-containing SOCS box protein 3 isoform X1 [Exaiptasia diaphana]KXJ20468.1 SPRY domain-containing SOCS box protein 3 [Exaiptasia diaphana]